MSRKKLPGPKKMTRVLRYNTTVERASRLLGLCQLLNKKPAAFIREVTEAAVDQRLSDLGQRQSAA